MTPAIPVIDVRAAEAGDRAQLEMSSSKHIAKLFAHCQNVKRKRWLI